MKKLKVLKKLTVQIFAIFIAVFLAACAGPSSSADNEQNDEEKVYDSYIIGCIGNVILLDDVTKEEFDDFKTKITVSPTTAKPNPKQIYSVNENKMTLDSSALEKFFTLFWPKRDDSGKVIKVMWIYHQEGQPDKVFKFLTAEEANLFKKRLRKVVQAGPKNDYSTFSYTSNSDYEFWFLTDEGYDRYIHERWRQSDPLEIAVEYTILNAAPYYSKLGAEFLYWVSKYNFIEEEDYFVDNDKREIKITQSGRTKLGDLVF